MLTQSRIECAIWRDLLGSLQRQTAGVCLWQPREVLDLAEMLEAQLPIKLAAWVKRGNLVKGRSSAMVASGRPEKRSAAGDSMVAFPCSFGFNRRGRMV